MTRTSDPIQDSALKRRNRASAVGSEASLVAGTAFLRAGFGDATLILRWREIAGPQVASLAQPVKLFEGPSGGILTLRTAPGAALFLAHEKRALCERINAYLGRPAITQLKFSQGTVLRPKILPRPQKASRPVSPGDPSARYQGPESLMKALQALARRR